ncbi:MAG TPA: cell division protein SepF [Clostridiales bacterium]|nr:cell division protein SepF [Clostridiales bacterium]
MANLIKNFLSTMKLTEDDEEYDDYVQDELEKEEKRSKRFEKKEQKMDRYEEAQAKQAFAAQSSQKTSDFKNEKVVTRMERTSSNKVVPIRTTAKGLEVCIMKPTTFEDSQEICDMLLTGRAIVINLEGFDDKLAQRTMDFISGSVYAINGKLHRISNCIFIVSPDTVDISGDYSDLIQSSSFEPPTLQSRF